EPAVVGLRRDVEPQSDARDTWGGEIDLRKLGLRIAAVPVCQRGRGPQPADTGADRPSRLFALGALPRETTDLGSPRDEISQRKIGELAGQGCRKGAREAAPVAIRECPHHDR